MMGQRSYEMVTPATNIGTSSDPHSSLIAAPLPIHESARHNVGISNSHTLISYSQTVSTKWIGVTKHSDSIIMQRE